MIHLNRKRIAFRWMFVCLIGLMAPYQQLEADWSTTQFEVVQGAPDSFLDALAEGVGIVDLEESTATEIEDFLAEAAREYEFLGFREPALDYKSAGGFAYQVFVFDFSDDDSPAGYSKSCRDDKGRRYIRIDSSRIMNGGKIDPKFLEHLAHELFHAVQGSYDLFYNHCMLGDWIVEGTAEAVGVDTAFKLRNIVPPEPRIRWGGRAYNTRLWVADDDMSRKDEAYWTSSLWRYIGEKNTLASANPGTRYTPADYRYLVKFFEQDVNGASSPSAEIAWLDEVLDKYMDSGLESIYPNFVSTFAGYIPARAGTGKNAETWRKWLFGQCPKLSLSANQKTVTFSPTLDIVASGCFELDISAPDWADVSLTIGNLDKKELDALSVGTADGAKVGNATIFEVPGEQGNHVGSWLFRVPATPPQVFVISNVSPRAGETQALAPILEISLSSWNSSMTKPTPQAPQGKKTAGGTGPQSASQAKPAQNANTANSLSANVAGGARVFLMPDRLPCQEAFIYKGCGPSTQIRLSLMPGPTGNLRYVTTTGGQMAQVMGNFKDMVTAGPETLGADWMNSAQSLADMDGAEVSIVIPLIDYGFSGSFNNASISVSGAGDAFFYAMGPRDGIRGAEIEFPLSGTVQIDEFSPTIMRGTYSADLVDQNRIPPFTTDDPVLPIHATIQGSFNIVSPWEGDRRVNVIVDTESLADDMREAFPGTDKFPGSSGIDPGVVSGGAVGAGKTGPGSGMLQCDCSCNQAVNPNPLCESACGSTYQACAGIKHEAPEKTAEELADENAEVLALRQKFEELMESVFPGDPGAPLRETMMDTFIQLESLNEMKMMILSYGGEL